MQRYHAATLAISMAAAAFALSGCSGESRLSVEPDALGEKVANDLAAHNGSATIPNVNCGEDKIYPEPELVVMCVLSVYGDEAEYDVTVTFDTVDDGVYHLTSQVAAEPRA